MLPPPPPKLNLNAPTAPEQQNANQLIAHTSDLSHEVIESCPSLRLRRVDIEGGEVLVNFNPETKVRKKLIGYNEDGSEIWEILEGVGMWEATPTK